MDTREHRVAGPLMVEVLEERLLPASMVEYIIVVAVIALIAIAAF